MKSILINYNFDWRWIKDYTDDYLIYDRSEGAVPEDKVILTKNVGNADYDRLSYLVDHYDDLPEVFLWSKSNLFKYAEREVFEEAWKSQRFCPILSQNHRTYEDGLGTVCFYKDGMYYERNNSWYLSELSHHYASYADFAYDFQLPSPQYLPFNPGGNFILTRERVYRYSRDYYDRLRSILPYCQLPGEAHFCERSYYTLWS